MPPPGQPEQIPLDPRPDLPIEPQVQEPTPRAWTTAKTAFTRWGKAVAAGIATSAMFHRAARSYTRASGGSRVVAASAISGHQGIQRLGGFLATTGTQGIVAAIRTLGAGDLTGASSDVVLCRIVDALAPVPNTLEESWTRTAMIRTIEYWQSTVDLQGDDRSVSTPEEVKELMTMFLANYANERFQQEIGNRLDSGSLPEEAALDLMGQSREYIVNLIQSDDQFEGIDPMTFEWEGPDGKALAERAFADAYRLLEQQGDDE
jgi:hypothetical protein